MEQAITGFFQDEEDHWVAQLACGHTQHVRHNPPLSNRPWVLSEGSRQDFIGQTLFCKLCPTAEDEQVQTS